MKNMPTKNVNSKTNITTTENFLVCSSCRLKCHEGHSFEYVRTKRDLKRDDEVDCMCEHET